jgi:hypothetical protein
MRPGGTKQLGESEMNNGLVNDMRLLTSTIQKMEVSAWLRDELDLVCSTEVLIDEITGGQ